MLATFLRYFNSNLRKSLVAEDNMKFFRIYVWTWTCVSNICLNKNSCEYHAAFVLVAALKTNKLLLNILNVFRCYLFTRMVSKISYYCTSLFFGFLLKITFFFFCAYRAFFQNFNSRRDPEKTFHSLRQKFVCFLSIILGSSLFFLIRN